MCTKFKHPQNPVKPLHTLSRKPNDTQEWRYYLTSSRIFHRYLLVGFEEKVLVNKSCHRPIIYQLKINLSLYIGIIHSYMIFYRDCMSEPLWNASIIRLGFWLTIAGIFYVSREIRSVIQRYICNDNFWSDHLFKIVQMSIGIRINLTLPSSSPLIKFQMMYRSV